MTHPTPEPMDLPEQPTDEVDTGDLLAVPEADRLDHDDHVPDEINADELVVDFTDVPDGDYVDLTGGQ